MARSKTKLSNQIKDPPDGFPKTFDEFYNACKAVLIHGTREQQQKVWKLLNKGKGDLAWARVGLIAEAYNHADVKGKEEFCSVAMKRHLKSGSAVLLSEVFTDQETNIQYRQYRFKNSRIYRIPIASDGMDKHAYDKALNKKFMGDYIEMHSGDEVKYIKLDTKGKVEDYNNGDFFKKHRLP